MKSKKLRLLLLTSDMERGEISDYIIDVSRFLQSKGIVPIVMSAGGYEVNRLRRSGITHIQVPLHSSNPFSLWASFRKIKEVVKEYDISLVHANTPLTGWLALRLRQILNLKYTSTFHYPYTDIGQKKLSLFKRLRFYGLIHSNHIFTSLEYIRNGLKHDADLKNNISYLPRWVDTKFFSPEHISSERLIALTQKWNVPDGLPLILNISEEEDSNDSLFLKALAGLPHRNFGVLMVRNWANPEHPLYKKLRKEAEALDVFKSISFVLPEDDEPLMYKIADLIVCPTKVSFARIALQTQAMGKLILIPTVDGASDQVETGKTGRLFVQNSLQSLMDSLSWGLGLSSVERGEIADTARKFAQNLDKDRILPQFLKVCNSLI
ncbi:MAG: glycosyltransferase [Alphaproteobacteria bacterium]|nr:glycosyltransferase [Alphaproteobacteria bacterium]MBN2780158.1 glycosyltransferase [Alphaproteobacteria bacterium]